MNAYERYSLSGSAGQSALQLLEPQPGQLPAPLAAAYRRILDARGEAEIQAAAREFLVLSREGV